MAGADRGQHTVPPALCSAGSRGPGAALVRSPGWPPGWASTELRAWSKDRLSIGKPWAASSPGVQATRSVGSWGRGHQQVTPPAAA